MTENEMREINGMAIYLDENCAGLFVLGYANPLPIVDFVRSLYKAGCRIVPDGAVVLSKEEYDDLKRRPSMREWVETCRGRIEQARKETAREILNRIANHIPAFQYETLPEAQRNLVTNEDWLNAYLLKELAREYGVEVDE